MLGGLSGPPLEEKGRSQGWVVDLSMCPHCKNTVSSTSQLCFSNSSRDLAYINLSSQSGPSFSCLSRELRFHFVTLANT